MQYTRCTADAWMDTLGFVSQHHVIHDCMLSSVMALQQWGARAYMYREGLGARQPTLMGLGTWRRHAIGRVPARRTAAVGLGGSTSADGGTPWRIRRNGGGGGGRPRRPRPDALPRRRGVGYSAVSRQAWRDVTRGRRPRRPAAGSRTRR